MYNLVSCTPWMPLAFCCHSSLAVGGCNGIRLVGQGTMITAGRGRAVVVGTGPNTAIGKIRHAADCCLPAYVSQPSSQSTCLLLVCGSMWCLR